MEEFHCIQRCPHGVGMEGFTVYRGVLMGLEWGVHCIQRCPNFRRVGMEEFHCIQRCPHGVGMEGFTVYRGVLMGLEWRGSLYTEVSEFQEGWNGGVPLYTEVSSWDWNGEVHCIQRCPHGVGMEGFTVYRGVLISGD